MKLQIWHRFLSLLKRKTSQKAFVFVAIGDSTVEGVGASSPDKSFASVVFKSIKQKRKDAQFFNLGVKGARVKDVISHQLNKAIALSPDMVLISIGANDVFRGTRESKFEREFKYLLDSLSRETQATVVVNNIPDISLTPKISKIAWAYCSIRIKRFNKRIQRYAQKMGTIFVDLHDLSQVFKGYGELVSKDGLHPSDIGYAIWANAILSKLTPNLKL